MFWIYLILVLLCRAFDLGTTFLVTPDLRLEINPLVRKSGWGRTILLNAIVCFVVAEMAIVHDWWMPSVVLNGLSLLAGIWNLKVWREIKKIQNNKSVDSQ